MDFFDYIINRNAAQKENPGKLSSYREAAELICMCWNRLDMSVKSVWLFQNKVVPLYPTIDHETGGDSESGALSCN